MDKFKKAIKGRKDFMPEVITAPEAIPAPEKIPASAPSPIPAPTAVGTGIFPCAGIERLAPDGDMYVKGTSSGAELRIVVNTKKDTLADLHAKAEFLKANAKSLEQAAKTMEKVFKDARKNALKEAQKKARKKPKKATKKQVEQMQQDIKKSQEILNSDYAQEALRKAAMQMQDAGYQMPEKEIPEPSPNPASAADAGFNQPELNPQAAPQMMQSQLLDTIKILEQSGQPVPEEMKKMAEAMQAGTGKAAGNPSTQAPCDITMLCLTLNPAQMSGVSRSDAKLKLGESITLYVRGDFENKWFVLPEGFQLGWQADKELEVTPGPGHTFSIKLIASVSVFASFTVSVTDRRGMQTKETLMISQVG